MQQKGSTVVEEVGHLLTQLLMQSRGLRMVQYKKWRTAGVDF